MSNTNDLDGQDKIDIKAIDDAKPINNKNVVTGVLPTGNYSKLLVRENYPKDLVISAIANKFANRFDNPSYYHGSNWEKFGGAVDGCDIDTEIPIGEGADLDGGDTP